MRFWEFLSVWWSCEMQLLQIIYQHDIAQDTSVDGEGGKYETKNFNKNQWKKLPSTSPSWPDGDVDECNSSSFSRKEYQHQQRMHLNLQMQQVLSSILIRQNDDCCLDFMSPPVAICNKICFQGEWIIVPVSSILYSTYGGNLWRTILRVFDTWLIGISSR